MESKEEDIGRFGMDKLWEDLLSLTAAEVCSRTLSEEVAGGYRLKYLGENFLIHTGERTILPEEEGLEDRRNSRYGFIMSLLYYLIHAKDVPPSGSWISPRDLPGGSLFFRAQHDFSTAAVEKKYGNDPEGLLRLGATLGASRIDIGDAGLEIPVFPRISYGLVLWKGDKEYPGRINLLVDSRITLHYPEPVPLDALLISVQEFLYRLAGE